ncbi:MAG: tRNA (guanine(26)-N(2))-dimethyltransferase [Halobacteriales archaeon]
MRPIREGGVAIRVPDDEGEGAGDEVFYNPEQELNRDLTVAVLRAFRDRTARGGREGAVGSYLDAMTASGVRAVRAAAAGFDVTALDVDPEAVDLAGENLSRNDLDGDVRRGDANVDLHENHYDVVDLDPFGTPIPYADAAFRGARDLLCVTATDTAPLCGAHFEPGIRRYGAVPRNTEYHAEMGLRVLLSALARTGARYDVGVTPLFSHATRHYVRTYLALDRSASAANATVEELGYVYHCQDCLYRETERGLIADPPADCPNCGSGRVVTAGPIWLEAIRDRAFLAEVTENLTPEMGEAESARDLIGTLRAELDEPTHYDHHRLCEAWGRSAAPMDEFLDDLRAAGFDASRAHYAGTAFKTDGTVGEIRDATG